MLHIESAAATLHRAATGTFVGSAWLAGDDADGAIETGANVEIDAGPASARLP
jgi:hypothetical protein